MKEGKLRKTFRGVFLMMCVLVSQTNQIRQSTTTSLTSTDTTWCDTCKNDKIVQSPINIEPPFKYICNYSTIKQYNYQNSSLYSISSHYGKQTQNTQAKTYLQVAISAHFPMMMFFSKPMKSNLKLQVNIQQSIIQYKSYFKKIGETQKHYALEIQISAMSYDQKISTVAIFFNIGEENEFLDNLGFGSGLLQHFEENNFFAVSKAVDLSVVIKPDADYIIYLGTETYPPCEDTIWIIGFDTLELSQEQLDDFPKNLLYEIRSIQKTKIPELFVTFDDSETSSNKKSAIKQTNKDFYSIIGDDTVYEIDFGYGEITTDKVISNQDYIVVTKEAAGSLGKEEAKEQIKTVLQEISMEENVQLWDNDDQSTNFLKKQAV